MSVSLGNRRVASCASDNTINSSDAEALNEWLQLRSRLGVKMSWILCVSWLPGHSHAADANVPKSTKLSPSFAFMQAMNAWISMLQMPWTKNLCIQSIKDEVGFTWRLSSWSASRQVSSYVIPTAFPEASKRLGPNTVFSLASRSKEAQTSQSLARADRSGLLQLTSTM